MEFRSSRHILFHFFLFVFPVGTAIYLLITGTKTFLNFELSSTYIVTIIAFLFTILILWLMLNAYRNTTYIIGGNQLFYKMGILQGSIPIHKIWLIKVSTYPTSGIRPALDWNGLKFVHGKD